MNGSASPARLVPAGPDFPDLLRHWRGLRRMSQLGLSLEAGISTRHLCFLEKGKSRPSREMVTLLSHVLDIPLAERNALLVAAGYAPAFSAGSLAAPELAAAQRALDFMLAQQEPYPALVLDEGWTIRQRNTAAVKVFGAMRAAYTLPDALAQNAMHILCHPGGLRPFMLNWAEFVGAFLQILHREASQGLNAAAARLRSELLAYPDMPASSADPHALPDAPMTVMRLRVGPQVLSFFVTLTTFAMPRDVALQQVKIECFFPADDATAAAARRLFAED